MIVYKFKLFAVSIKLLWIFIVAISSHKFLLQIFMIAFAKNQNSFIIIIL